MDFNCLRACKASRAHVPFSLTNQIEELDLFYQMFFPEDKSTGYEIIMKYEKSMAKDYCKADTKC